MGGNRNSNNLNNIGGGGGSSGAGASGISPIFNHVARPPSHSTSSSGKFVTDKPTSDPKYPGHRFLSSNISGTKVTQIYNHKGDVVQTK